jgi:curli production assembly/transport component CsgG
MTRFKNHSLRTSHLRTTALCLSLAVGLGACAAHNIPKFKQPELTPPTATQSLLSALPSPREKIAVAVYGFTDQTGQFKPTEAGQTLSRAVTQGATSILVKALQDAGNRSWFTVVERERLENLLKERQIIREMRMRYLGEKDINPQALPPLLFAGVLLEGGVIGYDSNTMSGGAGARFLGIGASTEYRQDTVTVYLRAISTKTGEVLSNVVTRKTIASIGVSANTFRYVAFKELLEAEAGFTTNEPDQLALQQAVEKAVHAMIMEGSQLGLWQFSDRAKGQALIDKYQIEKYGKVVPVRMAQAATPQAVSSRAAKPNPPVRMAAVPPVAVKMPGVVAPRPLDLIPRPADTPESTPVKRIWYPSGADLKTDNAVLAAVTTLMPSDSATDVAAEPATSASDAKPMADAPLQSTVHPVAAIPNPAVSAGATAAITGVQGIVILPGGGAADASSVGDNRLFGPID